MANTTPRRNLPKRVRPAGKEPWHNADPTRKIGINIPIPEPLMSQLDWLVENKAIFSKASFIRDVVSSAAEDEINRLYKIREATKHIDRRK